MSDVTCARPGCENRRAPKPPTGPQSPYCGRSCRDAAAYLRAKARGQRPSRRVAAVKDCPVCGVSFTAAKSNKQLYCSPRCGSAAHRDRPESCCSAGECERPVRAKELCASHYKAKYGAERNWSKGRAETRRRNLRTKTARRRAAERDPNAEAIDRDEIGDRDGWRCGLCRQKVNRDLPYPHPRSPSLDHIEPLSLGGKHTRLNVQITHLGCNLAKSNKGGGEQLLLIG